MVIFDAVGAGVIVPFPTPRPTVVGALDGSSVDLNSGELVGLATGAGVGGKSQSMSPPSPYRSGTQQGQSTKGTCEAKRIGVNSVDWLIVPVMAKWRRKGKFDSVNVTANCSLPIPPHPLWNLMCD